VRVLAHQSPHPNPLPEGEGTRPRDTRSTCPYCGVGCGVVIQHRAGQITGVRGDPDHPANFGRLCSKGQALHLTAAPHITAQVRALHPMRRAERGGPLHRIGWDSALDEVATRLHTLIERDGPDAVGFYISGQLLTEDYHAFNKLAKGLVGTNNVDTNSRLCMSSAVAGHKASLGADSVPCCYEDIDHADTVFITGSHMAWAHPVLYRRLEAARAARPGMKVIVADPRRTETAAEATLHLPLLPGTDVVLHHALLHVMVWESLVDASYIARHTTGFEALRDRVREFTPAHAAKLCGLKADDIVTAARWMAGVQADGTRTPTLSLWCQGLNQSVAGTDKNTTLINLHLACGQIGKRGAGPFSLTGQPNAMGGREVGGLAQLLPGHREVAHPQHRAEVAALWGVHELPATPGKAATEMFRAAAEGQIKALWIVCTNPAHSLPDQALVRRALERCEFVVLQEASRLTATAAFADVLLPAAGWGEKEGSVTNSERRISRVRAAVPAPGEARADWAIVAEVGRRLEQRLPNRRLPAFAGQSMFNWPDAQTVWQEHRAATRGRDLDITGLAWADLDTPAQWPRPEGAEASRQRLYEDGVFATPDGRARFHAPAWRPTAEARDAHYPVSLTTGRVRDQWHGMARTGTLGRLFAHTPTPSVQMHPQELARRKWAEGDLVRVKSRRGALLLPLQADAGVSPAQAFVAMHWGEEWLGGDNGPGVNVLTTSAHCPQSQQPELKHTAVKVEKAELAWHFEAAAWLPADTALALRETLQQQAAASGWAYWHAVPVAPLLAVRDAHGREVLGLHLRAAAAAEPAAACWQALLAALDLAEGAAGQLRYDDPRAGRHRRVRLDGQGRVIGFALVGERAAAHWLRDWMLAGSAARAHGRALLAGQAQAPGDAPAALGALVCSCHGVSASAIDAVLLRAAGAPPAERLYAVQSATGCGTGCGSCLPALKARLAALPSSSATPSATTA
jgi:assimilatory nitrate reductase catalytic subunit